MGKVSIITYLKNKLKNKRTEGTAHALNISMSP
jgi:hypothetical protein